MSGDDFCRWESRMVEVGKVGPSADEVGDLFGVHRNTVYRWRVAGCPRHVRFACRALWHELEGDCW